MAWRNKEVFIQIYSIIQTFRQGRNGPLLSVLLIILVSLIKPDMSEIPRNGIVLMICERNVEGATFMSKS